MDIKLALIVCKDPKTDDQLRDIMATHPGWVPRHGFYRPGSSVETHGTPAAIWIDRGITNYVPDAKWLVENFHVPRIDDWDLPLEINDYLLYWDRQCKLQKAWWKASLALVYYEIPSEYWRYHVYYGELEDDYDGSRGGDAAVAEEGWRRALLDHFDCAPEVKAALGIAEAAR
jgi:hypothetical protein